MAIYIWGMFLLASLQFESVEPSRALQRLNKQFNLLRKSVERDIDDLRYEVTDLQTQLELERDRASKFEVLFNASAAAQGEFSFPDLSGQASDTQDLREKYSTLEKEVENLKKENAKLRKLQHDVESHENEITEAKQTIKKLNDSTTQLMNANGNNIKTFTDLENDFRKLGDDLKESVQETVVIVTQAFQAEKKQLRDFQEGLLQGQRNLESEVEKILNGSILTELDSKHEACDEVRDIIDGLTDDIDDVREDIDAVSRKTANNENDCKTKHVVARDCLDIHTQRPQAPSGPYKITIAQTRSLMVWCDMTTEGGGWTVFQKRFDGSVDFYRTFAEYQEGFGSVSGEFWLGLENTYELTVGHINTLRVDITHCNGSHLHEEMGFNLGPGPQYVLHLTSPSYTMSTFNGSPFTTKDVDRDTYPSGNCAVMFYGGFWYNGCIVYANPNGPYNPGGTNFDMTYYSMIGNRAMDMKFRRNT